MSNEIKQLQTQIQQLKKKNRIMSVGLLLIALVMIMRIIADDHNLPPQQLIRAQGIIIEDAEGRDRILIGAPIPASINRNRTDTAIIRETWGEMLGDQYMDWYQGYNHSANGIVFLDENGWDKIALGDPVPDPIFGKRIGPSTGIVYNDSLGLERSGYGVILANGTYRVGLGLDSDNGTEGASFFLHDNGSSGMFINTENQDIYIGKTTASHFASPDSSEFTGISIRKNRENPTTFEWEEKSE